MPPTAVSNEAGQQLCFCKEEGDCAVLQEGSCGCSRVKYPNGAINNLLPQDAPAHNWYRFVLSFPPHLVRDYIQRFDLNSSTSILDPFCGTGTTLVEAKKHGIPSVGVEALPVSHLAASTKVDWSSDPDNLESHARSIVDSALDILKEEGISDIQNGQTSEHKELRTLGRDSNRLLLKNSISPLPLHKTLVLLDAINDASHNGFSKYERVALAHALVRTIGNLRFGPEVGVGRIQKDAPVVVPWLERVLIITRDLRLLSDMASVPSSVYHGDARDMENLIPPQTISAVITSPPYPNEKDYTRTSRLESVLLGYLQSRDDLRSTKRLLLRSNTRGVYKEDTDDQWVRDYKEVQHLAQAIESRRIELGKTSGFERQYHRVAKLYFGGMLRHFLSLKRILKPGARLAYVVGDQASYLRVMIRTGKLLEKIAQSAGYSVEGIELFRTRNATATSKQLREEVLILQWKGS